MADFNIRSDSVNVEQIMEQIRARIREKRGVDYTEQQIRELAAVKLERFLDPQKVRSGLLEQFREGGISPTENYSFEDTTLFESHRAPLRWIRRLLRPVLKLLLNPNPLIHVLHMQAGINNRQTQYTEISYELLHNLVIETTRLGIEVKNLKMRVESMSSRFDFAERRARALEGVVQSRADRQERTDRDRGDRPERGDRPDRGERDRGERPDRQDRRERQHDARRAPQPAPTPQAPQPQPAAAAEATPVAQPNGGPGQAPGREGDGSTETRKRRRRRRGRRGANRPGAEGAPGAAPTEAGDDSLTGAADECRDDAGRDDDRRDDQPTGTGDPAAAPPDREDQ